MHRLLLPTALLALTRGTRILVEEKTTALLAAAAGGQPTRIDGEIAGRLADGGGVALVGFVAEGSGDLAALGAAGERVRSRWPSWWPWWKGAEVRAEGRWHVGSNTKSMTASLAAVLVKEGLLPGWDATLAELTDLASNSTYANVTLRQLLGMMAGLAHDPPQGWWDYGADGADLRTQRQQAAADALRSEPMATPGANYTYSNWAYVLAAHLCEEAAGGVYEEILQQRIFAPLNVSLDVGAPTSQEDPWGHYGDAQEPCNPTGRCDNPPVMTPAGGFSGTTAAYAAYAAWHVRCHRGEDDSGILSQAECQEIHAPADPLVSNYGFGWQCFSRQWAGGLALTHTGSNTNWYHMVWLAPGINRAFVAGTNGGGRSNNADSTMLDATIGDLITM